MRVTGVRVTWANVWSAETHPFTLFNPTLSHYGMAQHTELKQCVCLNVGPRSAIPISITQGHIEVDHPCFVENIIIPIAIMVMWPWMTPSNW